MSSGTYTCNNGRVTLGSNDRITASANVSIVSHNGFNLASGTIVGTTGVSINLTSSYGTITSTNTTTIYGTVSSGSGAITLVNATVSGTVTAAANIDLNGGSVAAINGTSGTVTTLNTTINGAVSGAGNVSVSGGSVSAGVTSTGGSVSTSNTTIGGSISASSGGITSTGTTVSGSVSAGGNINLTGGSVTGLVSSAGNTITTNGTNLSGGATAQSGMSITGGTIAGNFTMTSNNAATFSAVTMVSGSITGASIVSIQNGSLLGSSSSSITISSNSGAITVNNSTVYGALTAPSYSTVNVTNGGQVFGTCVPGSTPASACSAAPPNACPDGYSSGITGYYYNNTTLTEPNSSTRSDGPINFNWGSAAPGPAGVDADTFSVRWTGYIRATVSGNYRFRTVSDDGVRLYVNDDLVINRWNDHSSATDTTGNIALVAGQTYSLVLEYYENGGSAIIQLSWLTPGSGSYVAIPAGPSPTLGSGLYECTAVVKPPVSSCSTSLTAGITGKYYNNMLASGTVTASRLDGPINFDWSTGAPGPAGVNAENFSVSWDGYIRVSQSGNYRFQTNSDDGIRLTVNGDLLINQWNDHSVTMHTSPVVSLTAGSSYPIKLEFYENGGYAVAQLLWQTPSNSSYTAIPRGSSPVSAAGLYECVTTPAAYSVSTNANGLTCAAEAVTVTALNASLAAFNPPAGTVVTLTTNSANAAWVGGNTYTFTGSESTFVKYLQQITPATVQITATSATATGSSSITFADVGLKIADNFSQAAPVPVTNQIAGIAGTARLKVIRKDNNTGACVAQVGVGTRPVSLGFTCNNPTTCVAGQKFFVNGAEITANNNGATVSYSNVNLTFDNNGEAPLAINYSDVGRVTLHGQLTLTASGNNPAITLTGSSDLFVVKPHSIVVSRVERLSGVANPGGTTAVGAAAQFVAAGEQFRVLLEARNGASPSALTPNFGREGSPDAAETGFLKIKTKSLVHPSGGTATDLTVISAISAITPQGTFLFSDVRWNQVGSILIEPHFDDGNALTTNDGDYLGAGNIPNLVASSTVGRFYPDHFAVVTPSLTNGCGAFTYMGQPSLSLKYNLEARTTSGAGGLSNYGLTYTNNTTPTLVYVAENGNLGTDIGSRFTDGVTKTWVNGVVIVDAPGSSFARLNAAAVDGPYASTQIGLKLTDTFDLRAITALDMNADTAGNCSPTCTAKTLGSTINIRYGRIRLDDAFGPETINLPVNFVTEFWNGNRFVRNVDDSCTQILRSAINYPIGNILTDANRTVALAGGNTTGNYSVMNATQVSFTGGDGGNFFTAPTGTGTGEFTINVDLTTYPWLRFDWNQSGTVPDNANCLLPKTNTSRESDCDIRARIGFGRFRGHDRVIYWRERF
ncbi:MAG TPA: DUF6701 domain-containing protein [Cellvibrio sp.]|nr:DUF6701 domain-containing protein [Cellvibrio sp.]